MKSSTSKIVHNGPKPLSGKGAQTVNDQRPEAIVQRQMVDMITNSDRVVAQRRQIESGFQQLPVQRKPIGGGLPTNLKSGIEHLSGISMDDVKVHYNSSKPSQLHAHAYAQGNQIHLGSGQEKHLPHEAWHVVQQKQGRVQATMQHNGAAINDDKGLEREADVMGTKAVQMKVDRVCPQRVGGV